MPHRSYASTANYRFGFNGKENDNEPKGLGNEIDYGARVFDPRIGRFMSLDPLQKKYPNESNYSFVSNSPLLFKDEDGKDKIVTITIIGKDGTTMQIKMTDKKYFEYSADKTVVNIFQAYKSDRKIDVTIDFSKSTTGLLPAISFTSERINPQEISKYEYSKLSDWISALSFNDKPTERGEKYGYRILGSGDDNDWNDGLPKPSKGSEYLDLKGWLNLASGLKGENAEYEEKVMKMFSVILLEDKVEKIGKLEKTTHILENSSDVAIALADLIEEYKELHAEKKEHKENTVVTPIIPLFRTVRNKNGNLENIPWGKGSSRTTSTTKDSGSSDGSKIYRITTKYKKN